MIASLPLEEMTIEDKISTMEMLWNDICRYPNEFQSPEWHGEILQEREDNFQQGKDQFEDWEEVKNEIWKSVT